MTNIQRKTMKKYLEAMSSTCRLKGGQKWIGPTAMYVFVDRLYGDFEARPSNLIRQWRSGRSGHPERLKLYLRRKMASRGRPVQDVDSGAVYSSTGAASRALGVSDTCVQTSIRTGWKVRGREFIYLEGHALRAYKERVTTNV